VISFLRFLGVANAAIWLGAAVFVTCLAGPAFFSAEMLAVFGGQRYYAGAAAEVFISRYFFLHEYAPRSPCCICSQSDFTLAAISPAPRSRSGFCSSPSRSAAG
jgi:hypothetical protein